MKKYLSLLTIIALTLGLLSGCVGTPVVINECTCPTGSTQTTEPTVPTQTDLPEGAVKTGLAVSAAVSDSTSASPDKNGAVKYDVTLAGVTVDDEGIIRSCYIDAIPATVEFNAAGVITSDLTASVSTKNELGADYGMVAYGGAIAEWDSQVAALCHYAVGKTVEELKNGAIDETGKAPEGSDLASSATIYLGGFVSIIEDAVNNAQHLGAQSEDNLRLVTLNKLSSSTSATADNTGFAQLDADIALVTEKDGVITSCVIDSLQGKVEFDTTGTITTDLHLLLPTKNDLGDSYGMVNYGGAKAEWYQQAAAFAAYVTGKTAQEVSGISVSETTKPADGSDLASSVTIAIGGFQALIAKAFIQ